MKFGDIVEIGIVLGDTTTVLILGPGNGQYRTDEGTTPSAVDFSCLVLARGKNTDTSIWPLHQTAEFPSFLRNETVIEEGPEL